MILLAETTINFKQAPDRVYPYITNLENYGEWFPGVLTIEPVDATSPWKVGKRYREKLALATGDAELTIEVKASEHNQLLYTEGDLEFVLPAMKMQFEEQSSQGTRFHLSYYSRNASLADDPALIELLQQDLNSKIEIAARNLEKIFTREKER